jgi:predicted GNAT family acetyltransferase
MENNFNYIVYCTVNTVNDKIYVGVHKTNTREFDGYLGCGVKVNSPSSYEHPKTAFQYAVKKYGPGVFRRHTLHELQTEDEAYLMESLIVTESFVARNDTYNLATGGKIGFKTSKKIFQFNDHGVKIKEFESFSDAAKFHGVHIRSIQRSTWEGRKCRGFYFSESECIEITQKIKTDTKIYQYDKSGKFLKEFKNTRYAAEVLKINHSNIILSLKLGTICHGFYFSYIESEKFDKANSQRIDNQKIYQYSLSGEFIAEYQNMQEAKNNLKIKSNIYQAIKLKRTAGGFQWKFEKFDRIDKITEKSGRPRKVAKYDESMNLIKTYESKAQAEKENGRGLAHVLSGRDKTHKGYIYQYIEN